MKEHVPEQVLNMGDIRVVRAPYVLTCIGLGSCIGLFLLDRVQKIAGGAHIVLPQYSDASPDTPKSYYAEEAIEEMLHTFAAHGSDLLSIRAKITGGASLFGHPSGTVGQKNVAAVRRLLVQRKIFIAATHVGGNSSRTARFNAQNGTLEVKLLNMKPYIL